MPAPALFEAGADRWTEAGRARLFDLSGVLSNLNNRIAIVGFPDDAGPDRWRTAIARGEAVVQELRGSGYDGPVTVLGRGEPLSEIQIMILPEATER
jgi:hypothetical protein